MISGKQINISICGVGHLGGSMLSGLLKAGVPSTNILGIVRDKKKAEIKYKEAGVKFTENAEDILEFNGDKVHVLLLCIPPKLVKSYIKKNIVAISKCDPILVNACAGIMYSQMRGWLIDGFREANMHNEKQLWNPRLCIVMPSISIATLEGIALCYLKNLSESDLEIVNHFVGLVSKQVARVNDERELYGSVYAGGSFPGIISCLISMANEQLKNIGYNPEPLKHVVPSIYKSIGSVHSPAKSGSSNHIAAPTFPHIKNDEILSVLIGAVDPNGSWYHKMDNAATCAINRHIEVSKLLDEQD